MSTVFVWENDDGTTDACELDIYDTETHGMPCEVSKFPVETGPDVTDNIRTLPKTLVLEGYVSDSPGPLGNLGGKYGGSFQPVTLDVPASPNYQLKTEDLHSPGSPLQANVSSLVSAGFNALKGAILGDSDTATVMRRGPDKPNERVQAQVWTWDHWESHMAEAFRLLEKARDTKRLVTAITDLKTYDNMAVTDVQVPRKTEDGAGAPFAVHLEQVAIVSSKDTEAPKPSENIAKKTKSLGSKSGKEGAEGSEKRKTLAKTIAVKLGLLK